MGWVRSSDLQGLIMQYDEWTAHCCRNRDAWLTATELRPAHTALVTACGGVKRESTTLLKGALHITEGQGGGGWVVAGLNASVSKVSSCSGITAAEAMQAFLVKLCQVEQLRWTVLDTVTGPVLGME